MLAASKGAKVEICADGVDEKEALIQLIELVENCFGEND